MNQGGTGTRIGDDVLGIAVYPREFGGGEKKKGGVGRAWKGLLEADLTGCCISITPDVS